MKYSQIQTELEAMGLPSQINQKNHSFVKKQTIMLGIFFFLLVTTYASFSYIITYIFDHEQGYYTFEGPLLLIINYSSYFIVLSLTPSIKNYKKMFLIAGLLYSTNYALQALEIKGVVGLSISIFGSIIAGGSAALAWVSQGAYMMKLFRTYHIHKNQEGKYFGLLNGIVDANSLSGALVTTFGLGFFGSGVYFLILVGVGLFAMIFCWMFLDSLKNPPSFNSQSLDNAQNAEGKNSILTNEENEKLQKETVDQEEENKLINCEEMKVEVKKIIDFYPPMRHMMLLVLLDGFMLGYISSGITELIPQELNNDGINAGILLSILGFGAIFGGSVSGILSDYFTIIFLGRVCCILTALCCSITMLCISLEVQTLTLPFICALLWGFSFNFFEGWICVACAKTFFGRIQSFAIVRQMHTMSFVIFQVYLIICGESVNWIYTFAFIIGFCVICFYFIGNLTRTFKDDSKNIEEKNNRVRENQIANAEQISDDLNQ